MTATCQLYLVSQRTGRSIYIGLRTDSYRSTTSPRRVIRYNGGKSRLAQEAYDELVFDVHAVNDFDRQGDGCAVDN